MILIFSYLLRQFVVNIPYVFGKRHVQRSLCSHLYSLICDVSVFLWKLLSGLFIFGFSNCFLMIMWLGFYDLWVIFCQIWKIISYYFFKKIFSFPLFLLFLGLKLYIHRFLGITPQVTEGLFIDFFFKSPFLSVLKFELIFLTHLQVHKLFLP